MPGKLESVISVGDALKIFVTWRAKWRQEDCVDCYCDYNDTDAQRFIDYTEEMMQQFENMTFKKKKKLFKAIYLRPVLTTSPTPVLMCRICLSCDTYHSGEYCSEYLCCNGQHKGIQPCDDVTSDTQSDQCGKYNGTIRDLRCTSQDFMKFLHLDPQSIK